MKTTKAITAKMLIGLLVGLATLPTRAYSQANDGGQIVEQKETRSTSDRFEDLKRQFDRNRHELTAEVLQSFADDVQVYNGRAYPKKAVEIAGKKKKFPFPWQLKCSSVDYRTIHGCLELRFFDPSARVYFDNGNDDPDEVDLFNDGNLNVTVDLASVYFPWRLGRSEFYDAWSWGPVFGAGLSASAEDSSSGETEVSGAAVVLLSAGGMLEYKLQSGAAFAFELGWSTGYSTDESFGDIDDSAIYAGLRIKVPLGVKDSPKAKK